MFGLVGANAVVSGKRLGKFPLYGGIVVILFDLGRLMLVLPFCPQPRFEFYNLHQVIGGIIFTLGLICCIPSFVIRPITSPDKRIKLQTTGFYAYTRNPIYLGEILWCLGWAIIFRSSIGLALVPVWWIALLIHIVIEEDSMERELGHEYVEYKNKVKGRIIPFLPF